MNRDSEASTNIEVNLRRVSTDDISWMSAMESDPVAVGVHNWDGVAKTEADVEQRLRRGMEKTGLISEAVGTLVVELADGTPIGNVSWRSEHWGPSEKSRCPAFGIALLPEFRGKGYGTEAQLRLIDYLFENTSAYRVQSDTAADNLAEQRVLQKIGMTEEGVVRQAEFRDGDYHDHTLFSILRPEWEGRRNRDH